MTSSADLSTHGNVGLPSASSSYGDSPTEGVSYKKTNGHVKKRASRAGTRSVSTLSAAQLERKRANDREAQRAIRQRTKDHIDGLEKTLNDVKQTLDAREKLLNAAHQRNRELEDENAMLRMRLESTGNPAPLPTKFARPSDAGLTSAPASAVSEASGSISQRSGSISHGFNMNSGVMQGAWQQQSGFPPASGNLMLSTNNDTASRTMTGWRARDSPQASSSLQGLHPPQTIPYTPHGAEDRSAWSNQYEYGVPPPQATQHFGQQASASQPSDHQYGQGAGSAFQSASQQSQAFHPPLLPPNDYQAMSSQAFYQFTPQAQGFPAQSQYGQTGQVQTSNGNFTNAQVQASPVSATQYHNSGADQAFSQQIHPPMQFRDDAEFRNYSMPQFPSG